MLSREERARQFLPFSALSGLENALREKEIEHMAKLEMSLEDLDFNGKGNFMKYMFISDVHGNIDRLEDCLKAFDSEKADKLIILGDTSSRESESDNELIASMLNNIKSKIEVIRGNCDTQDFEDELDVEMFDMDTLYINKKFVTITHGHYYNYLELPSNCGEIFIQGHTHIPILQKQNGKIFANPGSVSRPRGSDLRCYIIMDDEKISLKTLEGNLVKEEYFTK